jgi:hypothetical protein
MAKVSRSEWFASLEPGDIASATLPGEKSPRVGTVETVNATGAIVRFAGREMALHFGTDGALLGEPGCLLWMVSTGGGGSTAPAIKVSNVLETLKEQLT